MLSVQRLVRAGAHAPMAVLGTPVGNATQHSPAETCRALHAAVLDAMARHRQGQDSGCSLATAPHATAALARPGPPAAGALQACRHAAPPACTASAAVQHRHFLGSAAPVSKRHRERRLMAFSRKQLYDVVADVDQYVNFVPWCRRSVVTRIVDDTHFEADLEVGFQLFSECYTSKVTLKEPEKIVSEAADSSVFHKLLFTWEFAPGPTANTTWTTFHVDYSFKNIIYGQTSVLFFDQVVSQMISAFDKRCRQVYGKQR